MEQQLRKFSLAFIDENEYSEVWENIEGFSDYSEAYGFARGDQ